MAGRHADGARRGPVARVRRLPTRGGPWFLALLIPGLAVCVAPPALAALGGLLRVTPCVPGGGLGGWLGLHLALVHPSAACGSDELALGAAQPDVLRVIATLALPTLLAHLGAAASAAGVLAAARAALRTLALRTGWVRLPGEPAGLPTAPGRAFGPTAVPARRGPLGLPRAIPRRGPPVPAPA